MHIMNRFLSRFHQRRCCVTLSPHRLFSNSAATTTTKLCISGIPEFDTIPHDQQYDKFLFMTTVSAPLMDTQNRSAIDLVCVLDESGSMSGEPMELLKSSMKFIVSNLTSNDRFGCIGYDDTIRTISNLNYMTSTMKQDTLRAIECMDARTLTALGQGLEAGVNMMRECILSDSKQELDTQHRVKNVLLLTDGQANVGYTDPKDIIRALTDREFAEQAPDRVLCSGTSLPPRKSMLDQSRKVIQRLGEWTELKASNSQSEVDRIYKQIPCSIDTFGFGSYHDANFLTLLSEYGRGLYTFISSTDDIAGTFGEMLGGMLSVMAKDIKITIKSMSSDIKISRCLVADHNSSLKLTEIQKEQHFEIEVMNDIQSEEQRDLLFELQLPKIEGTNSEWNYIQIQCDYFNLITNQREQISTICKLQRESAKEDSGSMVRNHTIDIQYNRIMSTNAVRKAMEMAGKGQLEEAKAVIKEAEEKIKNSVSRDDDYCKSLIKDLEACVESMQSKQRYESVGLKRGQTFTQSNRMQRVYQTDSASVDMDSFRHWGTKAKSMWRKKAETQTKH